VSAGTFAAVIGQGTAVDRLVEAAQNPVHAYLLVGPRGSGTRPAAVAFGALLLASDLTGDAAERALRLGLEAKHPDLVVIEARGRTLRVGTAGDPGELAAIRQAAVRSPVEGARKVVLVPDVDQSEDEVPAALLKLVEEPPASTIFVFTAQEVPDPLVTVASRCVTVEFGPVPRHLVAGTLVDEGVEAERARAAADASGGDLERARLLAGDDALAARQRLWWELPDRLDGSGSAVVAAVRDLRAALDEAQGPLEAHHAEELAELQARIERLGERGSGRAELTARHKREVRRQRDDELRFGLATVARRYHQSLVERADPAAERSLAAIHAASEALVRNPSEALLLQALALELSPVPGRPEGLGRG
jgi:DNA polymerase III subunit delta'